jgi:hypothetical protein
MFFRDTFFMGHEWTKNYSIVIQFEASPEWQPSMGDPSSILLLSKSDLIRKKNFSWAVLKLHACQKSNN